MRPPSLLQLTPFGRPSSVEPTGNHSMLYTYRLLDVIASRLEEYALQVLP